jgi:hypothetical protein
MQPHSRHFFSLPLAYLTPPPPMYNDDIKPFLLLVYEHGPEEGSLHELRERVLLPPPQLSLLASGLLGLEEEAEEGRGGRHGGRRGEASSLGVEAVVGGEEGGHRTLRPEEVVGGGAGPQQLPV